MLYPYLPPARTRLVMVGYPADDDPSTARRRMLTVTENCWTAGGAVVSPYFNSKEYPGSNDWSQHHNCTTYGGNSGGPMYSEGTRLVVGLPFTYIRDVYTRTDDDDATAALALMADFVSVHAIELKAAGIAIAY